RARARLMEDFRDNHFNLYFVHIMQETRKPESDRDLQRIESAKAEIILGFDRIESELQGKEYLVGTFSLADVAFMSNLELLDRFNIAVDPVKYKNTVAWIARLKARPSFAASAT
ncbi:MAG TPA: glutathione S-transferase family protein, partial [Terriglobales bacterium]|nr:glutathione S-transferase family protein [Terriglobales bacterium]